jgi:hypothetical protein
VSWCAGDSESCQQRAALCQLQCKAMQQHIKHRNYTDETLDDFLNSTPFIPESQFWTLNSSSENLRTRICILYFKGTEFGSRLWGRQSSSSSYVSFLCQLMAVCLSRCMFDPYNGVNYHKL